MIAILAALALAASAPPDEVTPPEDTAATLEQLRQIYEQSCSAREFGAYDDICDQLSHQIKAAQVEADRAARHRPVDPKRAVDPGPPTPASTPPPSTTPSAGQIPGAPGL